MKFGVVKTGPTRKMYGKFGKFSQTRKRFFRGAVFVCTLYSGMNAVYSETSLHEITAIMAKFGFMPQEYYIAPTDHCFRNS